MPTDPTGSEREKNSAIVKEVLDLTGYATKESKPAETKEDETIRRFTLANEEVVRQLHIYYEANPITSNAFEVEKLISKIYIQELSKWSKDDLMFMLLLQTTKLAMKKWGYPVINMKQGNKIWTPGS